MTNLSETDNGMILLTLDPETAQQLVAATSIFRNTELGEIYTTLAMHLGEPYMVRNDDGDVVPFDSLEVSV